jgi:hypothetical protein
MISDTEVDQLRAQGFTALSTWAGRDWVAYDAAVGDDADTTRSVYTAKHEESGELSGSSALGRSGAY